MHIISYNDAIIESSLKKFFTASLNNIEYCLYINNNQIHIDGFILDTTWRAILHYVLSILDACFCHSSVPIALAFGGGETISL